MALHELAREWAEKFRKGDAEYQTDEKWYLAAAAARPPARTSCGASRLPVRTFWSERGFYEPEAPQTPATAPTCSAVTRPV